jgi:hypothetical protein
MGELKAWMNYGKAEGMEELGESKQRSRHEGTMGELKA